MPKNVHVTDEIKLEGFQAILEPGKFGYSLSAVVDEGVIDALETERQALLGWAESKLKNPKRATLKPTPWEEVADGKYKIKFSWGEDKRPGVVDTEGRAHPSLMQRHHYMVDQQLSLVSFRSHTSSEMALPTEVALSCLVYKLLL
jgi:hypothetical protein